MKTFSLMFCFCLVFILLFVSVVFCCCLVANFCLVLLCCGSLCIPFYFCRVLPLSSCIAFALVCFAFALLRIVLYFSLFFFFFFSFAVFCVCLVALILFCFFCSVFLYEVKLIAETVILRLMMVKKKKHGNGR